MRSRSEGSGSPAALAFVFSVLALDRLPRRNWVGRGRASGHLIDCGRERALISALEGTYARESAMVVSEICGDDVG